MKPRTIHYYFKEAFRSVVKNRMMSVASIFTVASCIFIVTVFYLLSSNVEFFVGQLEDTIELVVFVDEDIDNAGLVRLEQMIRNIPRVTKVIHRSREDELDHFINRLGANEALEQRLEMDNPLRDSFIIQLSNLAYQEDVIRALDNLRPQGIINIRHSEDVANILVMISNIVQIVSIVLVLVLSIIAVVIITNTIRITVNARRNEINIMKYVGATDWFIRWPFVIEGAIIGLIGGILPAVLCWFGYNWVFTRIINTPLLAFVEFLPPGRIFIYLLPLAIIMGTAIGLIGSIVSVRKHLRV